MSFADSLIHNSSNLIKNLQMLISGLTNSEARFMINVREGLVELEGKESFVDKHLEKFEEIFKMAVKEAITHGLEQTIGLNAQAAQAGLPQESVNQRAMTSGAIEQ